MSAPALNDERWVDAWSAQRQAYRAEVRAAVAHFRASHPEYSEVRSERHSWCGRCLTAVHRHERKVVATMTDVLEAYRGAQ